MADKTINTKVVYFNGKIRSSLSQLQDYPCTLIEAPMGYGKTTAVREHLAGLKADIVWQSVYDQGDAEFWSGFCHAISRIDPDCGERLKKIGMPKESLMKREAMQLLGGLQIPKTTFLIIDDFHYVKSEEVSDFLETFVRNLPSGLHIIILSRKSVFNNSGEMQLKGIVNYIGSQTLQFLPADIKEYYRECGIRISDDELSEIYNRTEGWVSALYLLAREYTLHGRFLLTQSMSELIHKAVYEPLDDELKAFLRAVCLFDKFSLEQAAYMWGEGAEALLQKLMEYNAFITFDHESGNYTFHSIFASCVQEQFKRLTDKEQKEIWRKLGDLNLRDGLNLKAMENYFRAGDYEGILTALERDKGDSIFSEQKELCIKCFNSCPAEVKERHPIAILVYAVIMLINFSEFELYESTCRDFLRCLDNNRALTEAEKNQLMGEYELLLGIAAFNDMYEMGAHFAKAEALLSAPPESISANNSWTFGSPSILCLYHREAGRLRELIDYYQNTPSYINSTGGQGSGSRNLFEAELNYYTGDFENAEILTYKAIPEARASEQNLDVALCADFLLARLALLKGDFTGAQSLITQMRNEIKQKQVYTLIYTIELCDAYIYANLGQSDIIPDWLTQGEYQSNMFFPSVPFANIVLGKALLCQGKDTKLLGLSEQFLEQASFFPNLLASIYTEIYVAAANCRLFRIDSANDALKRAVDMAAPDYLIMPFVENLGELAPLLDILLREEKYSGFIKDIMEIGSQYRSALDRIKAEHFTNNFPKLTAREKEIALLVIEGLNNKEIGEALYVSPNTVKRDLKSIFFKLDISSRVLLTKDMII